jgi:hypothetical protein
MFEGLFDAEDDEGTVVPSASSTSTNSDKTYFKHPAHFERRPASGFVGLLNQ